MLPGDGGCPEGADSSLGGVCVAGSRREGTRGTTSLETPYCLLWVTVECGVGVVHVG